MEKTSRSRIRVGADVSKTRKLKVSRLARKYDLTESEVVNRILSHGIKNSKQIFE